jgi:diguanylate cyclase (GGDEF)-like protein
MAKDTNRGNERNLDADDHGLGRESMFTRMVDDLRINQEKFKESKQQAQWDKAKFALSEERLDEIERKALIDETTGLFNRRAFVRKFQYELNRAKRYKRPLSILMMQVDKLDDLGRRLGALTKDDILLAAAKIIKDSIRDVDIPARISHEQVGIIFPETYSSRAIIVAERIRNKLRNEQISNELKTLRVTASLGVASFPTHARNIDELFAKAEECLTIAQQEGGDQVHTV